MRITVGALRRIINEEKQRLLTETMMEWENYPSIPDYIMGEVVPELANMIDAKVTVSLGPDVINDIVTNALMDCMSTIAQDLGIDEPPEREYITLRDPNVNRGR